MILRDKSFDVLGRDVIMSMCVSCLNTMYVFALAGFDVAAGFSQFHHLVRLFVHLWLQLRCAEPACRGKHNVHTIKVDD